MSVNFISMLFSFKMALNKMYLHKNFLILTFRWLNIVIPYNSLHQLVLQLDLIPFNFYSGFYPKPHPFEREQDQTATGG